MAMSGRKAVSPIQSTHQARNATVLYSTERFLQTQWRSRAEPRVVEEKEEELGANRSPYGK
jgi:predicted secreted protein